MVTGKESPESLSHGRLNLFKRFYLTALVTVYALFPPCRESCVQPGVDRALSQIPHVALTRGNIRYYLADINRAADQQGEITLFFPGCFAFAAPSLLFRLKRSGFSNCRISMMGEGLLLSATR